MTRVAILGTGLIGASIGLRLRQSLKDVEVVGFDRFTDVARTAEKRGAITSSARSVQDAVKGADVVVIAVPVLAIERVMQEIAPVIGKETVITDTGSSKLQVLEWAAEHLRGHSGFIGGHPMAGKTEFGPAAADPDLFEGARWVLVPPVTASEHAISTATNLVETMGARLMFMDADEHDAYVAAVSHMPMLAATALFSMERASEAWPELAALAAGGFRDMTRLAATDPAMAFDITVTNRDHIVHWLDRYVATLQELRRRVADEEAEESLYKLIAATEWEYTGFRAGNVGREQRSTMSTLDGMDFGDFIAGSWVTDKLQALTKEAEDRVAARDAEKQMRRQV
jgi:prephenate dehydrogenase